MYSNVSIMMGTVHKTIPCIKIKIKNKKKGKSIKWCKDKHSMSCYAPSDLEMGTSSLFGSWGGHPVRHLLNKVWSVEICETICICNTSFYNTQKQGLRNVSRFHLPSGFFSKYPVDGWHSDDEKVTEKSCI